MWTWNDFTARMRAEWDGAKRILSRVLQPINNVWVRFKYRIGIRGDWDLSNWLGKFIIILPGFPRKLNDLLTFLISIRFVRNSIFNTARIMTVAYPALTVYLMAPTQTDNAEVVQKYALDAGIILITLDQGFLLIRRTDSAIKRLTNILPGPLKLPIDMIRAIAYVGDKSLQNLAVIFGIGAGSGLVGSHLFALGAGTYNKIEHGKFERTMNPYAQQYGELGLILWMFANVILIYPSMRTDVIAWRGKPLPPIPYYLHGTSSICCPVVNNVAQHESIVTNLHLLARAIGNSYFLMVPATAIYQAIRTNPSYAENAGAGMGFYLALCLTPSGAMSLLLYRYDKKLRTLIRTINTDEDFLNNEARINLIIRVLSSIIPLFSSLGFGIYWGSNAIAGNFTAEEFITGATVLTSIFSIAFLSGLVSMAYGRYRDVYEREELKNAYKYQSKSTGKTYSVRYHVSNLIHHTIFFDLDDDICDISYNKQRPDYDEIYVWMRKNDLYGPEVEAIKAALLDRRMKLAERQREETEVVYRNARVDRRSGFNEQSDTGLTTLTLPTAPLNYGLKSS